MINISQNNFALQHFLQIINSYGAFINLRSNVKLVNKLSPENEAVREVESSQKDYWDEFSSGLSNSESLSICNKIESIPIEYKAFLTQKLIKSETFYKKLKIQFKELYPELYNEMIVELEKHIEFLSFQKNERINIEQKILKMNSSFINSLANTVGGFSDGANISTTHFFMNVERKYNFKYDKKSIHEITNSLYTNKNYQLTFSDIEKVIEMLTNYTFFIKENEMVNPEMIMVSPRNANNIEKYQTACSIVSKSVNKIRKLIEEYYKLKLLL